MGFLTTTCILAVFLFSFTSEGYAEPDQVALPRDYGSSFVRYFSVDKRDRKPNVVRFMYIDADAAAAAEPGSPLPDGTRIVMAEHLVRQDGGGKTVFDRDGRMIATDTVSNIFVAEKRAGVGAEYDEALRNGDWEYAVFLGDGSRKADVDFDDCRTCHRQATRTDFIFSVAPNFNAVKR